jgi:hypothetical protein
MTEKPARSASGSEPGGYKPGTTYGPENLDGFSGLSFSLKKFLLLF